MWVVEGIKDAFGIWIGGRRESDGGLWLSFADDVVAWPWIGF